METTYRNTTSNHFSSLKNRISFKAIFAGVIMAIITQLLLSLLGIGIGLVNFTPTTDSQPFSGLGIGAIIWIILTIMISLFVGGWISGRLSASLDKSVRMLHGLLTWAIYSLFSVYLVTTSVGAILGGVGSLIGSSFSAAGSVIGASMPNVGNLITDNLNIGIDNQDLANLRKEAETILKQTEKDALQPDKLNKKVDKAVSEVKESGQDIAANPNNADVEVDNLLGKLFNISGDAISDIDKEALVNVVANRTNKSKSEAQEIVDNWVNTAQNIKEAAQKMAAEAKAKVEKTSEDVTDSLGKFAIYSFFALLLSGGAAVTGSSVVKNEDIYEDVN